MESAILLREDGTPRCRIGANPSEYLTAEKLDEFYREAPGIDFADLDALRECDKGDEIYAISVLGNEEINLGMAVGGNLPLIAKSVGIPFIALSPLLTAFVLFRYDETNTGNGYYYLEQNQNGDIIIHPVGGGLRPTKTKITSSELSDFVDGLPDDKSSDKLKAQLNEGAITDREAINKFSDAFPPSWW